MTKEGKKLPQRHGAEWSAEDLAYLNKKYGKISDDQIARYLQRTEQAIESKARKTGLKVGSRKDKPPIKEMILQELDKQDLSRAELADLTGISFSSLFKPLRSLLFSGKISSYDRKDIPGLGRGKVIYSLTREINPLEKGKVEV